MRSKLDHPARQVLLVVITGLVVYFVRTGLHSSPPTAGWASIEHLLPKWFINTMGVLLLGVIAGACIMHFYKFFVGSPEPDVEEVMFYVVMTVLIAAISIYVLATLSFDDFDD
jgi:hypothetical protein